MRYIRPASLTWWAGVLMVATGLGVMVFPEYSVVGEIVGALVGTGDADPVLLIGTGLGIIGIRDKMERS